MCDLGSSQTTTTSPNSSAQGLTLSQLQRQDALLQLLGPELAANLQQGFTDSSNQRSVNTRSQQLQAGAAGAALTDPTLEAQAQQAYQQFQRMQGQQGMQDQILQMQLRALQQGGSATPEQAALIDQATASAQRSGESDINRWLQQTQRQIDEESAQAAGLRPTDTPVTANVARAFEEGARQQGQLTAGLQGANANAKLNYPLAAQQVQSAGAGSAASLNLAAQQFQQQLAQQAQQNRLALAQSPISNAFSYAGLASPSSAGSTSSASSSPGLFGTLQGLGQAAGGVGSLINAGSTLFSDRRLKSNIRRIGTHQLGIGIYEYDIFGERQTGVMADEVLRVLPEAVVVDQTGFYCVNYALLV